MSLKPLRVEESAVGTGGLCGSAFLNFRFEEHVRNRIGHSKFDEMKVKKGRTWQMGLRYFEEFVKRNFNEDEHQEVNVPYVSVPPACFHLPQANTLLASPASLMTRKRA